MDFLKAILINIISYVDSVRYVTSTVSEISDVSTFSQNNSESRFWPLVINTWPFYEAGERAWQTLSENGSALDAIEQGCSVCERLQCDFTVGFGGSPDEKGETTLDAMIMDGETHNVGAVAALHSIKDAISVARQVLERTKHTLLVGQKATDFAVGLGYKRHDLTTKRSHNQYTTWIESDCQPNFWQNVVPDPSKSCGPYRIKEKSSTGIIKDSKRPDFNDRNHDTIGMIAIDKNGKMAAGTSTNGANHKIPGRVGDSAIPGSGAYVDKEVGGAAATGDGDVMMRFLPSYATVEGMRQGLEPSQAAQEALMRITKYYPEFQGAIVATTKDGIHGAACHGFDTFHYVLGHPSSPRAQVFPVECGK